MKKNGCLYPLLHSYSQNLNLYRCTSNCLCGCQSHQIWYMSWCLWNCVALRRWTVALEVVTDDIMIILRVAVRFSISLTHFIQILLGCCLSQKRHLCISYVSIRWWVSFLLCCNAGSLMFYYSMRILLTQYFLIISPHNFLYLLFFLQYESLDIEGHQRQAWPWLEPYKLTVSNKIDQCVIHYFPFNNSRCGVMKHCYRGASCGSSICPHAETVR